MSLNWYFCFFYLLWDIMELVVFLPLFLSIFLLLGNRELRKRKKFFYLLLFQFIFLVEISKKKNSLRACLTVLWNQQKMLPVFWVVWPKCGSVFKGAEAEASLLVEKKLMLLIGNKTLTDADKKGRHWIFDIYIWNSCNENIWMIIVCLLSGFFFPFLNYLHRPLMMIAIKQGRW